MKKHAEFDAIKANHLNDGPGESDAAPIHVEIGMKHKTRLADASEQPTRKPTYERVQKERHRNMGNGAADGGVLHASHERTRLPDAPVLDTDIVDSNPA